MGHPGRQADRSATAQVHRSGCVAGPRFMRGVEWFDHARNLSRHYRFPAAASDFTATCNRVAFPNSGSDGAARCSSTWCHRAGVSLTRLEALLTILSPSQRCRR